MCGQKRAWQVLAILVVLAIGADVASAQSTTEELMERLEERDRIMADLVRRVEQLERMVASTRIQPTPPAAAEPVAKTAAPGQFEVDADAIERALERSLVQTGALLLPVGSFEVTPHFGYTRREDDAPVSVLEGDATFVGQSDLRRDEVDAGLGFRFGLPLDSQLELTVPFRYVDQSTATSVGLAPLSETSRSVSAFGDIGVGLAHTFVRESGWRPDLIGRVRWDSASGKMAKGGVALGGGFNELSGSLTAIKRQDPLVFVGSVLYNAAFAKNGADPGGSFGVSLGAFLAASPETSLRFVFDQQFTREFKVAGEKIDGSDQTVGALTVGASSVLGRGILLDVAGSIGLTDDSPDYAVRISLPIRF